MSKGHISYSEQELAWIKSNSHRSRRDIAADFAKRFNRSDVSEDNIKGLCTRMRWSAGAAGKSRTRGKSLLFSPDQIEWLRSNATLARTEVHPAFCAAFPNTEVSAKQIIAFRKRAGIKTGRTGRFKPGQDPWSKGRKIGSHPNSRATQFSKGAAPMNALPIGTERLRDDGYVEIKIERTNPYTGAPTWFVAKHVYLWERDNGPVPDGHCLKCIDGDKTNCDPNNWLAIPRELLPLLSGRWVTLKFEDAEPEIKPYLLAAAKLRQATKKARTPKQQNSA